MFPQSEKTQRHGDMKDISFQRKRVVEQDISISGNPKITRYQVNPLNDKVALTSALLLPDTQRKHDCSRKRGTPLKFLSFQRIRRPVTTATVTRFISNRETQRKTCLCLYQMGVFLLKRKMGQNQGATKCSKLDTLCI